MPTGWVAERLNALVLKTSKGESPSWVRIPPHPPLSNKNRYLAPSIAALFYCEFAKNRPASLA